NSHRSERLHCGISARAGQHGHLAKIIAVPKNGKLLLFSTLRSKDFAFAFLNYINAIAQIPLAENHVARLKVLLSDTGCRRDVELDQFRREKQRHEPVDGDEQLSVPAGHLHEVNTTQQEPRKKSGDPEAEHV